jgi:hypothetical protein
MKSFVVHCQCPTPLAVNPLKVEAEDEKQAKELFFARNGISGTVHPIEITEAEILKAKPKKYNDRSTRNNQK